MDAQQFVAEFGHIANAPGGVARLREMILQLAITGKLVAQIDNETPVEHTLAKVAKHRHDYEKQLEIRSRDRSSTPNDQAFIIPKHWRWTTLDNIALYIQRGKGPSYATHGKVYTVSQKSVRWSGFDASSARPITDASLTGYSEERFLCPGDLLLNSTGTGTVGRSVVLTTLPDHRLVADSHVTVIRLAGVAPKYIWCILASPWIQARIDPAHSKTLVSGTTQQVELANSTVRSLAIPLPPVEEQSRIVAKVDELMALCDKLETQQQQRETRKTVLAGALLTRFAEEPTQANLHNLFHSSRAITPADLRKAILTLAVQGRLVPQDPKDESAEILIKNINRERLAAIKMRLISPMKVLPPVEEGEIAYNVRPDWVLTRLIELVMEIQTGPFGSSLHKSDYQVGGTPVINPASLKDGKIVPIESMAIGPDTLKRLEVFRLNEGDIVMARRGEMGRCAIVTKTEQGWLCGTGSLVLRMPTGMYAPFLSLLIGAPEAREYLGGASVGTTMQNLNQGILAKMPVGVPPLAEQRRIVAKVDELMTLVDKLEKQLATANTIGKHLVETVVSTLTGISTGEPQSPPYQTNPTRT